MWKLKIGAETVGEGGSGGEWVRSLNNHLGRQVWEFYPELGTPEELQQIQDARDAFFNHRFQKQHSSDLLMRIQVHPTSSILELSNWGFLYYSFFLFFFGQLSLCIVRPCVVCYDGNIFSWTSLLESGKHNLLLLDAML